MNCKADQIFHISFDISYYVPHLSSKRLVSQRQVQFSRGKLARVDEPPGDRTVAGLERSAAGAGAQSGIMDSKLRESASVRQAIR